jgi:hypothetical protein
MLRSPAHAQSASENRETDVLQRRRVADEPSITVPATPRL